MRLPMPRLRLRRPASVAAVALVVALLSACGGGGGGTGTESTAEGEAGGTYRIGWENTFGFTNNFDPTGEYLGEAHGIYTSLLIRRLVAYNHVAGAAGNEVVADIATEIPEPTNDGKTYTFEIKDGVMFSPPLNRAVTSADFRYAFERLAKPDNGGQYSFYYNVIEGFEEFGEGNGDTISGIETPDDNTIVFNLTQPAGDFLYRLAMPAVGPIPEEVASCYDGKPGFYGRVLVSTGPYMIEGADQANASSCSTLKNFSGYDGTTKLILVRNPSYDADTDSTASRESLPDRFEWIVNANADDIFAKIDAGELDDHVSSIPPQVLRRFTTDPNLENRVHQNSGDRTWYLTMNLTQPPFDDLNVRKAMNWVMDKHGLVQAWGGPAIGDVAQHIIPNSMLNDALIDYEPYKTEGDLGDVAKAKAAMQGSKYDTAGNGTCSAPECKNVLLVADTRATDEKMLPVIQASAAKIGITFTVRTIEGAYPAIQTPSRNIPIAERPGWGKDYADAYTFFSPLFDGRTIIGNGNTNYSLVGITPEKAKEVKVTGSVENVPSVDADLDACAVLTGTERVDCYGALDRKLMEEVVPWVPYLWQNTVHITSERVTKWDFDQSAGSISYAHVAVEAE
jgi:peptide/nickel transport system substrate-binding protein